MKYLIHLEELRKLECEVIADDPSTARSLALQLAQHMPLGSEQSIQRYVTTVKQVGEPWLGEACWYDLHEPGDVFLIQPSIGNRLTDADADLVKSRLESLGLGIIDMWGGGEFRSFRCVGRKGTGPMSPEDTAVITAPRP